MDPFYRVYWLTEYSKRYGTLPFAGHARAAFIAVELLNSLVAKGLLSAEQKSEFLASIKTVSSQMNYDKSHMTLDELKSTYGHLRPGTYDILSPRYDSDPDFYFGSSPSSDNLPTTQKFSLPIDQLLLIDSTLKKSKLGINALQLFKFMSKCIAARESSKFYFTKYLSSSLEALAEIGNQFGYSRDDMSFCRYSSVKDIFIQGLDPKTVLARSIDEGKTHYATTMTTSLPLLLSNPNQAWCYQLTEIQANYITAKSFSGAITSNLSDNLSNIAVLIESADPGYDWLFSRNIGALITCWGGLNSHMAIRCSEHNIPAIIGIGSEKFEELRQANSININCQAHSYEYL